MRSTVSSKLSPALSKPCCFELSSALIAHPLYLLSVLYQSCLHRQTGSYLPDRHPPARVSLDRLKIPSARGSFRRAQPLLLRPDCSDVRSKSAVQCEHRSKAGPP